MWNEGFINPIPACLYFVYLDMCFRYCFYVVLCCFILFCIIKILKGKGSEKRKEERRRRDGGEGETVREREERGGKKEKRKGK